MYVNLFLDVNKDISITFVERKAVLTSVTPYPHTRFKYSSIVVKIAVANLKAHGRVQ